MPRVRSTGRLDRPLQRPTRAAKSPFAGGRGPAAEPGERNQTTNRVHVRARVGGERACVRARSREWVRVFTITVVLPARNRPRDGRQSSKGVDPAGPPCSRPPVGPRRTRWNRSGPRHAGAGGWASGAPPADSKVLVVHVGLISRLGHPSLLRYPDSDMLTRNSRLGFTRFGYPDSEFGCGPQCRP